MAIVVLIFARAAVEVYLLRSVADYLSAVLFCLVLMLLVLSVLRRNRRL